MNIDVNQTSQGRDQQIPTQSYRKRMLPVIDVEANKQEPFSLVAPILKAALLMGAGGGFLLATVLTLSSVLSVPLGAWWSAVAQSHGHLQLYGWAGLFVLGVALHFLPRLRGTPLVGARLVPWIPGVLIVSLTLRAVSQPLLAAHLGNLWKIGLVSSGLLETGVYILVLALLILTAIRGTRPATRLAFWSVLPFFAGAFCSLVIASMFNLANMIQAASGSGLVLYTGDTLNITLGLFGFLVPMALAMSARSLPMYAGLDGFPRQVLWPLAGTYFVGLLLLCLGIDGGILPSSWIWIPNGLGMVLLGVDILVFVGFFLQLIRRRGKLPERVAKLAPSPEALAQTYQMQVKKEQTHYGSFVGLVATAYLWAMLGALLLLIDGVSVLTTGNEPVSFDAIRHSFALGFIALLLCGVAPRMLPSFSGREIASPKLVNATLWLGNIAVILRVCTILFAPLLSATQVSMITPYLFSLSGPCGLALAICLAINLWPTLRQSSR